MNPLASEIKQILQMSDDDILIKLLLDTLKKKEIAEHYVATMASQPMTSAMPHVTDWKEAFDTAISLSRNAAQQIKAAGIVSTPTNTDAKP